ncbi:DUF4270 family protein [Dyadobacter aurulentus]|uniref:DUF4270 family protein n=1 Tax=Dyadobacter sp. UC 10 TaxID=2605428 RepID=UPI001788C6B8|nr:DUF4270 family protein [Dyadobacter sp. UC 10]
MTSCDPWGDEIESPVQPDQDDFAVLFSDTSTVQLSTVITDSVMTGSATRMLIGRYVDPYFGKLQASTFFQPGTQNAITVPEQAVYDSLVVSMYFDAYSYGDTTKPLNLSVHRLLTDMLVDKPAYFNESSTPHEAAPIGRLKVTPLSRIRPRLVIRLSDVLGKDIFAKAKSNLLPSNTEWIDLVKGLVLKNSSTDNGAIFGLRTDSTAMLMYYHTPEVDGTRRDSTVLRSRAIYNQILSDRAGTPSANLPNSKRISQPSSQTGNMTFVQAGPGLMTRVDLPFIKRLRDVKYSAANRAILRITPKRLSITNQLRAPAKLYVYRVDKNNEFYLNSEGFPLQLIKLSATAPEPVSAPLVNDMFTNKQYYLLDVSSYVTELMASQASDPGGLVLRTSQFNEQNPDNRIKSTTYPAADTDFSQSFDRLIIGDQQSDDPGVRLELYYTSIKVK